jgi:hypothetical protein
VTKLTGDGSCRSLDASQLTYVSDDVFKLLPIQTEVNFNRRSTSALICFPWLRALSVRYYMSLNNVPVACAQVSPDLACLHQPFMSTSIIFYTGIFKAEKPCNKRSGLCLLTKTDHDAQNRTLVSLYGQEPAGCGRVAVQHNGVWSFICNKGWNDNDAKVVCRQLGLSHGQARNPVTYTHDRTEPQTYKTWMDNVNCAGNEDSLGNCPFSGWGSWDTSSCKNSELASVCCSEVTTHRISALNFAP